MSDKRWQMTVKKTVALLFLGFVLLAAGRFIYCFQLPVEELVPFRWDLSQWSIPSEAPQKLHYRSNLPQLGIAAVAMADAFQKGALARLQVLEETATVAATSASFDKDKERFFAIVKERKGKIIHEASQGLPPNRSLNITIGVNEQLFQSALDDLTSIGKIVRTEVTRTDRTEEFRSLFAKKQSSEEHVEALSKLRQLPDRVDVIALEEKLLGIEREIVTMGMQMGDFTPEESLSNISYSLREHQVDQETTNQQKVECQQYQETELHKEFRWQCLTKSHKELQ